MTNLQLSQMNRAQLIEAQEQAILTQDHDTLRRIADWMTSFDRLNNDGLSRAQRTWLNEEVEDLTADFDYDECERSFWIG